MITLNASGGSVTFTFSGNSTYLNDGTITVPVNSLALIIDESDMISFKKANSNDIFVSANIAEFGMTKAELESWYKENMVGSTGGGGGDITSGEVQTMIDSSISGKADSSAVTEEISAAVSGKADTDSLSAYTINEGIASSSQTYVVETPPYGSPSSIVNTLDNSYGGLRVYKVNNYSTCYLIGYDENDTEIGRITFSSENPTIIDTTGFTDVIIDRERISDSASTAIVEGKELTVIKKFSFYNNYWATDEETSVYFYNKAYNVTDAVRFDFAKKPDGINVTWGPWPELYITLTSGERTITGVAAYFDSKYFRSYYDQYDNHLLSIKESVFQDYAKSSAVTEEISAAVSGKVDTNTYTAYTAATDSTLANKQTTLTAGTGIDITDNVISATGGGGCEVEETVVYDRNTNRYTDYYGDNKLTYVAINYLGDKSQAFNMSLGFSIGDASSDLANSYIYFDYVNHSASTDISTDYLTVEYINDIQDFKVSITSAYQSDYWIKDIYNLTSEMAVLIPYYTINSGSPCTVITTDVVGLVEKVKGDVNSSTRSVNLESTEKNLSVTYYTNAGGSSNSTIGLEEIDGTNNKLKPNIQVGIGVSGWTEIAFNGTCNTNGNPKSPIIRLSGDTNSLDAFNTQWLINVEHYGNTYDSVIWSGSEFVFNSNWFGENGELGTASVTYDSASNILTIAYPLTAQVGDYTDNVEMSDIYNQNCQFGTAITKLEYYGEFVQPLKPYVQETRAALGGLSLVKLTQSEYNALTTKDDNVLYIVVPNP